MADPATPDVVQPHGTICPEVNGRQKSEGASITLSSACGPRTRTCRGFVPYPEALRREASCGAFLRCYRRANQRN